MINQKIRLILLSEQKYLRIPYQVRLARFTRIKNLLGQGVLFG